MKFSNPKKAGPQIKKKILCIPVHCGYFYSCHITTKYPNKVDERKCLRFKHDSQKPKMHLSIFSKSVLEKY
ncbi:MAG: hypothetical protein CL893_00085 [Dehalococcoidia bacterium]|nr:hypothetical protein [Dehalococcoidia bacterium]|tara:strand:- start:600 stop:812 length:213 start_codon:yes stop_codon:yes gene_type:complete